MQSVSKRAKTGHGKAPQLSAGGAANLKCPRRVSGHQDREAFLQDHDSCKLNKLLNKHEQPAYEQLHRSIATSSESGSKDPLCSFTPSYEGVTVIEGKQYLVLEVRNILPSLTPVLRGTMHAFPVHRAHLLCWQELIGPFDENSVRVMDVKIGCRLVALFLFIGHIVF